MLFPACSWGDRHGGWTHASSARDLVWQQFCCLRAEGLHAGEWEGRRHRLEHSSMTLTMHVDDISLNLIGRRDQSRLEVARDWPGTFRLGLVDHFQEKLGLPFGPAKAADIQRNRRGRQGGLTMTMPCPATSEGLCQCTKRGPMQNQTHDQGQVGKDLPLTHSHISFKACLKSLGKS